MRVVVPRATVIAISPPALLIATRGEQRLVGHTATTRRGREVSGSPSNPRRPKCGKAGIGADRGRLPVRSGRWPGYHVQDGERGWKSLGHTFERSRLGGAGDYRIGPFIIAGAYRDAGMVG